ncbi:MAG: BlaI/MecI/CopY family transcriptional regulator [Planctomycetales bacterium]|nr:BlaI/MecI/CopY family transcriptional regulator [Planctomycetales bacterium]MCA9169099.1 BlaI/MecI/CopY family transcriptional regulator [Planctomycetales bacterium]
MGERPALSKGEMEVARALWQMGPATVRAIHAAMTEQKAIDFATVQTYLRRLEAKGYATSKLDGRTRVYSARARAKTVIRETVNDLVERLFGGDTMPLMRHLIEERGITPDDLAELRKLIDGLDDANDTEVTS